MTVSTEQQAEGREVESAARSGTHTLPRKGLIVLLDHSEAGTYRPNRLSPNLWQDTGGTITNVPTFHISRN